MSEITQTLHTALRRLADAVLPKYERDEGMLTPAQFAAIKKLVPQGEQRSVRSSLL